MNYSFASCRLILSATPVSDTVTCHSIFYIHIRLVVQGRATTTTNSEYWSVFIWISRCGSIFIVGDGIKTTIICKKSLNLVKHLHKLQLRFFFIPSLTTILFYMCQEKSFIWHDIKNCHLIAIRRNKFAIL